MLRFFQVCAAARASEREEGESSYTSYCSFFVVKRLMIANGNYANGNANGNHATRVMVQC